jgi:TonB family protein
MNAKRTVSFRFLKAATVLLVLGNVVGIRLYSQTAQTEASARKAKLSAPPDYPELARKMNIQGVARVLLTVNADGKVAGVKELGGNPVLLAALVQAVKKWKYEPAAHDSEIEVRFEFVQNR